MGIPGAGPRWLAEARHESTIRHRDTASAATSVRYQSYTRGEAGFQARRAQGTEQRRALFNAGSDAETALSPVSNLFHEQFHFLLFTKT